MKALGADAGFMIALYDDRDGHHRKAKDDFVKYLDIPSFRLLLPWPILYESMRTRMVRNRPGIVAFDRDRRTLVSRGQLVMLDDQPYREDALEGCFNEAARPQASYRPLSLVDRVIRGMLSDKNLRIEYFLTYNAKDFADVCQKRSINLV
ncbi:MAG TPA: hypothetical protein VFJ58_23275 [Armatimonadota bacterium]|nr:hypothetical protein [Armatimonadota bacterium]